MSWLVSRKFWVRAAERAVKSAGQGILATWLGVGQVFGVEKTANLFTAEVLVGGGVGMAALSILTSIVSAGAGPDDDPSLV